MTIENSDDPSRDQMLPSPTPTPPVDDVGELQLKLSPSSPMRAVAAAIANRENVDSGQEGRPTYVYQQRTSPEKITVTFQPPETPIAIGTAEQFLRFIREAPETTGDALIIALDNWRQRSDAGAAWITADYILKCRGIKPKMKGGYAAGWRPDDLDEIARAMAMLDSTWLSIEDTTRVSSEGRRKKRVRELQNSRFLAVLDHRLRTVDGQPTNVAWRYSFGEWVTLYPFDDFFALASRKIVRYHPQKRLWERRLAIYAILHLKIAERRNLVHRTIRDVLEHTGLANEVDARNPQRSLSRFRDALKRLVDDGHFQGWTIDKHRDGDLDAYLFGSKGKPGVLPPRAWWTKFEQMTLSIIGGPSNGPLFDSETAALAP
jgi:hypothetical protein